MAISSKKFSRAAGGPRLDAIVQIGPAEGNYKRSPALTAQIHMLNKSDPETFYFLVDSRTNEFVPISIDSAAAMAISRKVRDNAVKTGDRSAVAALGQLLLNSQSGGNPEISLNVVIAQLTREYGGSVEKDIAILETIAEREGLIQIEKLVYGLSVELYDVTSV